MAIGLDTTYTFTSGTTIASAEVNQNFSEIEAVFDGLEAGTTTMALLKMDAAPASSTEVATKAYVDRLNGVRLPNKVYVSATQVDIENNTGTANQTTITLRNGTQLSVTEDTSSTHKYRRFDITATAEFTSGTEDSGLYAGESEANNTWYAIYAVQSQINTANFVLVGSTTFPAQGNIATLDANFGSGKWQYLGYIRNGDNAGVAGNILGFVQSGPLTVFTNQITSANLASGISGGVAGIRLATGTATSLTYTYAAGSGAAQIPASIGIGLYQGGVQSPSATSRLFDSGAARQYAMMPAVSNTLMSAWVNVDQGVKNDDTGSANTGRDIILSGFYDNSLAGTGLNPLR